MKTGAADDNRQKVLEYFGSNFFPFYEKHLPSLKKISGDEWAATCPFHEDRNPSLNFNARTGLFHCHGCKAGGDIFSFYGRLHGLSNGDFPRIVEGIAGDFGIAFSNGHRAKQDTPKSGRIVATYDYHDEAGGLLFQVCRMEPKTFRQRRPDGKGGWVWNLKGVEPVLYHLPEVLAADEVLLPEGEKDADALRALFFTATTNSMGAGKWRDSYTEALRGKDVVLLPDNDEPGREHALKVASALHGVAKSIKLILLPGLPEKGDVSDFIAQHEDPEMAAERLATIIDGSPTWEPGAEPGSETKGNRQSDEHIFGDPQPLVEKTLPAPYPTEALPGTVRQAVEEVQAFVKAPMALVASSALAAVSVVVQAHIDIERAKKLTGPTSLNFLTVADSGERKTSCDGFFNSAVRAFEMEQYKLFKPILSKHEAEKRGWAAKRAGLLEAIKKAAKGGRDTLKLDADLVDLQAIEPITPRRPQILLMDQTPEALAMHLAHRWPSAGILSAEAGVIFGAHGMSTDSVMRNLALLNILWDGGVFDQGRKVAESVRVEGARLTLGLQVQENPLRVFFERSNGLARGTGFLARFLISWPESTMGERMFTEAPKNWPALAQFHQRMSEILKFELPLDDEGILAPKLVFLSEAAKRIWIYFHDTVEGKLGKNGALYDVRDLAAKSADNAARMAAVFHFFKYGPEGAVGADDFHGAVKIVSWHLNESLRFFDEIAASSEIGNMRKLDAWLLDYCRRNGVSEVPTQKIQQFGPVRDRVTIELTAKQLAELDRAILVKDGKRKFIRVNPTLIEGGTQ